MHRRSTSAGCRAVGCSAWLVVLSGESILESPHTRARGVVVAHDYFTQRGGAERVALELAHRLGAVEVVTSVYQPDQTFGSARTYPIHELDSRIVKRFGSDPRKALPFLASAWKAHPPIEADALVCSSSGWAHGLRAAAGTRKIVYCHNPARWLYQHEDYTRGMSAAVRFALASLSPSLRRWDAAAAASADVYVANSTSVADRIYRVYGIEAQVVYPPISIDVTGSAEAIPGLDGGFFLTVARPRGYKGTEVLHDAFALMPSQRLVVVGADRSQPVPDNVTALGHVSDEQLRWLYAHARALISVSHEDFGLTPIEANAFGTPALVLRAGGFLDSTHEGVSGLFIEHDTVSSVVEAVSAFPDRFDRAAIVRHAARFSPEEFGARMNAIIRETQASAGSHHGAQHRAAA